jgi:hypothetical protein
LKKYVFRRHLKLSTFETFLRAFGRLFHSFGAATVKERSPSVALLFTFECSSRFISLDDLRLYLEVIFNSKSSEIYSGASPLSALNVKSRILNLIL